MIRNAVATFALCLVGAAPALADVNIQPNEEGELYTAVFVNGSSETKYDIVFIGDGFTEAEQDQFNFKVRGAVEALWNLHPYSEHMCAFNIWRVNVLSDESGVDHPLQNIYKDTELDCRYGEPGEAERCITSDSPVKCWEAANHAPASDAVFVLVNDEQWGGCAGGLVFASIHPDFHQIVTHELGHKIGSLADEYPYYFSEDDPPSTYTGPEPAQVNVTTKTVLSEIKWKDLIQPGTPLPTPDDTAPAVLGLYEGAKYCSDGIYRPEFLCQMRDSEIGFCAVCRRQMISRLEYYETEPQNLVCSGMLRKLLAMAHMRWTEPWFCKWPLPRCPQCPIAGNPMDEVVLFMEGLPAGMRLQIVDERGRVVSDATPHRGGMLASFHADPLGQYYAQAFSDRAASNEIVSIQVQLTINGLKQALP